MRGRDAGVHCDGQAHFPLAEGESVTVSARAVRARASCIPKATTTSRCCARSCTGARRPSALRGKADPTLTLAASARNVSRLSNACCACCRSATSSLVDALDVELDRRLRRADRRDRRRQVDPARRARPAARRPLRGAADSRRRRARRARRRASTSPTRRGVGAWLAENALAGDEGEVLVRRVLDAQGRARALRSTASRRRSRSSRRSASGWSTSTASTRTSRSSTPEAQRALVDAFGGFTTLAREVGGRWRAWRAAVERRDAAASAAQATAAEREFLDQPPARARRACGHRRANGASSTPRSRGSRTRRSSSRRRRRARSC